MNPPGLLASILGLLPCTTAAASPAGLHYSEAFDYGPTSGPLAGLNGGTGFASAWAPGNPGITYEANGLAFSNLLVSGGRAFATGANGIGNSVFRRDLAQAVVGTSYGSYLSRVQASSDFVDIAVGHNGPGSGFPYMDQGFVFATPISVNNGQALAVFAQGIHTCGLGGGHPATSGGPLNHAQTYLTLFKIDAPAGTATGWVLNAAQFDVVKAGGITEAELNAASLGSGANQIVARATQTQNACPIQAFTLGIFLNAFGGTSATLSLDELRLSDTSLDAVTPTVGTTMVKNCFPGTSGIAACPCGQPANPVGGCANFGAGATTGAVLDASGAASLAADTVVLTTSNHRPVTPITNVFFTGSGTQSSGVPHGAGVRCVSTALRRLYTGQTSNGTLSKPGGGDPSVSARCAALGVPISAGETRHYFNVYRDNQAAGPCGSTAITVNTTNAGSIAWSP